ncbi:serine racemase isoform X2 [Carettochelys insculpta]|uniref:serine racemase isoform X2 n=1 Tax=Carettochelys insculpta TaxID=44489 RepID=UPI003EBA22B6
MSSPYCISLADVEAAQSSLRGLIHLTPILTSSSLDQLAGRNLFFKCELFQKTGSFKIRGALNAVRSLALTARGNREQPKAVVTHSSGNHGQALAFAAKLEGIPAHIVVPRTAPHCKKAAICSYGAQVVPCEPTDESRVEVAARTVEERGGVMVHPNQDPAVIAGQGTIALEVLQQALRPDVRVYAAEPCNADDCYRSKVTGELTPNHHPPATIADSIKTSIGPNTWPIIKDLVDDVLTVTEEEIKAVACSRGSCDSFKSCSHTGREQAAFVFSQGIPQEQPWLSVTSVSLPCPTCIRGRPQLQPRLPKVKPRAPGKAEHSAHHRKLGAIPFLLPLAGVQIVLAL